MGVCHSVQHPLVKGWAVYTHVSYEETYLLVCCTNILNKVPVDIFFLFQIMSRDCTLGTVFLKHAERTL